MREVYLDTDPRPVEATVTGQGGMEAGPARLDSGFSVGDALRILRGMGGISFTGGKFPAKRPAPGDGGDQLDSYHYMLSSMPPIMPRCRSTLLSEGI